MSAPINNFLVDNRVAHRNVESNRLDKNELESFIKKLPDLEGQYDDISSQVFESDAHQVSLTGDFVASDDERE